MMIILDGAESPVNRLRVDNLALLHRRDSGPVVESSSGYDSRQIKCDTNARLLSHSLSSYAGAMDVRETLTSSLRR